MSSSGTVSLGQIRLQAYQRADRLNSQFVTTSEANAYLASSYKELYDLLATTYGADYYVAAPYTFQTTTNNFLYPLPTDLYKLIGVDLQITASPQSWITLRRFEFGERNRYWYPSIFSYAAYDNLRYKIEGSNLWLSAIPQQGQTIQLWYIPLPVNLQAAPICAVTSASTTVTTSDTSQLAVGMSLDNAFIPSTATISSITPNTSFVISSPATGTALNQVVFAWVDSQTFDGISGWEEYVILDVAIKMLLKEESDVSALMAQKQAMMERIYGTAPNRDAAEAPCVTDNMSDFGDFSSPWGWR